MSVLAILGLLSAISLGSFRPDTTGDAVAQTLAQHLASDMIALRRRAISTGDNHLIIFNTNGGSITGYGRYRSQGGSLIALEEEQAFPEYLSVTASTTISEFTFEGIALSANTVTLSGPNRQCQLVLIPSTGAVRVTTL